jgi:O-antigen/teichoic acid export membrane protein
MSVFKTSFWSFIQLTIVHLGTLVTTIALTRVLTKEDYGTLSIITSIVMVAAAIVALGVPGSTAKFLAEHNGTNVEGEIFFNSLLLISFQIGLFALLYAFLFPIYSNLTNNKIIYELRFLILLLIVFEVGRHFTLKACQGISKMHIVAKQSLLASTLLIVLTLVTLWKFPTISNILIVKILSLALPIILTLWILFNLLPTAHKICPPTSAPTKTQILRYGIPLTFTQLSGFLYAHANIILLSFYVNASDVALYSISAFVLMRLLIVPISIGMGVGPYYASTKAYGTKDKSVLSNAFKFVIIFTLPVALVSLFYGGEILASIFGAKYYSARTVLKILIFHFLMQSTVVITGQILDFTGKAKKRAIASVTGGLINIAITLTFAETYGIIAAAWATLIGYSVIFIVASMEVRWMQIVSVHNYLSKFIKLFILLIVSTLTLRYSNSITQGNLTMNLSVYAIVYIVMLPMLGLITKNDLRYILKISR